MNIEQIAQDVASGMPEFIWTEGVMYESGVTEKQAIEFLRRCLSKLAEQAGDEPVAKVLERNRRANDGDVWTERYVIWLNEVKCGENLYTEAQYLAAQQRTAEACAKVCASKAVADRTLFVHQDYMEGKLVALTQCEEAIRNGEWRMMP